ncbi:ABC transporter permease [Desulfofustis limnaeus]|jgi:putative ABC transport system permease protein|uniref:ABC transporter permease n=1 Tax=Desulfofustis limnaeus TaxID=2740163 RepID=A0ABM7W652_9BACT|nr:ABC transporter permease [Desulfofustis limnaeus]MDX9895424.1 ABC transporter permease [Desulfofustis sp.]BDD86315.1 ABC transporter permease [Desulfofustis limnaeus]
MLLGDLVRLSINSLLSQRLRSLLTLLGIGVGITSVVLLTSIGEGVHRFTLDEFTQFGSNLVAVNPGRTTTAGVSGALINTVRPLTFADEEAIKRLPGVTGTVSVVQGNAAVSFGKRIRRTTVLGTGPAVGEVWRMGVAIGRFLPDDEPRSARSFTVLGSKVADELFRDSSPLGRFVRIGDERYRVIGVMESKGQMLGFDLDDAVYIPTSRAMAMFNLEGLMEIDVLYREGLASRSIAERVKKVLIDRHGSEDFTITTQDEMLKVLGSVLDILTLAVGGLGAISLLVGGVGILTIMTIAVHERTPEIGLLRAIGADRRQIMLLFLGEAVVLAGIGGLAGLLTGAGIAWLLTTFLPALPTHTPWQYALYAELLAATIGLLAGILPAAHAARLHPVEALRTE